MTKADETPAEAVGPRSGLGLSVLIVDDSRLHCEGLAVQIEREPGTWQVRCCSDWASTVAMLSASAPDVTLVNLDSQGSRPLIPRLHSVLPTMPIIALGLLEVEQEIISLAESGVAGFLLRSETFADLVRLMRGVVAGETFLTPRASAALMRRLATLAAERDQRVPLLTDREDQILALLDAGLSNQQIADRLRIELRTVKNHVHNILGKLGVSRRGEAVAAVRSLRTARDFARPAPIAEPVARRVPVPRPA